MIFRPAGESRVFHDQQATLQPQRHSIWHPRWGATFQDAHTNALPQPVVVTLPIKRFWTRGKILLMATAAMVFMTILSLGAFSILYQNKALPATKLAGVSVSGKTETELKALVTAKSADFKVQISGADRPLTASAKDLGVTYDVEKTVQDVLKPSQSWIILPWERSKEVEYKLEVNQVVFEAYLQTIAKVSVAAQNATLDVVDGKTVIKPEVKGKSYGIDPTKSKNSVIAAAKKAQPITLNFNSYQSEPAVLAADLSTSKARAESIMSTKILLDINGSKISPTPTQIGSWIILTPDNAKKTVLVSLDKARISSYLDTIAKPFVKPPRPNVVVKNSDGTESMLSKGAPGIDIVNKDGVASEIVTTLNKTTALSKALPISYADPKTITAQDYEKWIHVDLTNKRMYAYEHGNLVKEFLVSAGAPATPTVKGQYIIKSKVRSQDMRGFNADGTRYYQPNVEYVNYFYQDYAIHGNYWRPASYFGNINSSHGCVGLPNSQAKWVYDWAPVGTPVIVHD